MNTELVFLMIISLYILTIPFLPKNYLEIFNHWLLKLILGSTVIVLSSYTKKNSLFFALAFILTVFAAQQISMQKVKTVSIHINNSETNNNVNTNNVNTNNVNTKNAYTTPTEDIKTKTNIEKFYAEDAITQRPDIIKAQKNQGYTNESYYPTDGQYFCKSHKVDNPCASNNILNASYGFATF